LGGALRTERRPTAFTPWALNALKIRSIETMMETNLEEKEKTDLKKQEMFFM
jgi:hypothetical protein